MNKEDKRLAINDLTIDDYLKDFKRAIDENDWYEIEGKFLKPLYEQIINLQQENKQLKEKYLNAVADYEYEKSKNNKAIEYFEIHKQECVIGRNKDDKLIKDYYLPAHLTPNIIEILKGDSNE